MLQLDKYNVNVTEYKMIDVFYIAYLKNNSGWGFEPFKKFLSTYEKYNAGIEHSLTILLRAFENNLEDYNKIKEICRQKNIKTLDTIDIGLDFGAYLDGAKQSNAEYICCLNTSCEIMSDDWLKKLYSPVLKNKNYKMVGVNGSWELCPEYITDYRFVKTKKEKIKTFLHQINIFRILYKFLFMKTFRKFPNYSIRTSAFLIDRNLFIEYFKVNKLPKDKLDSYKTETGDCSITRYILKNYNICVVDKYGTKFDKENFDKSNTYRSKKQNYIIKDRQVENYEKSNFLLKMYLRCICWGKFQQFF